MDVKADLCSLDKNGPKSFGCYAPVHICKVQICRPVIPFHLDGSILLFTRTNLPRPSPGEVMSFWCLSSAEHGI